MGQSSGLSPRAELDAISGSPGVSPSLVFIGGGEFENVVVHSYPEVRWRGPRASRRLQLFLHFPAYHFSVLNGEHQLAVMKKSQIFGWNFFNSVRLSHQCNDFL
jgi:hypothetical protein